MTDIQDLFKITEATITQDITDAYSDLIIIERSDMVVVSTQRIVIRYVNQIKPPAQRNTWVEKELSRNASGQVVKIKVLYIGPKKPIWITYPD